MTHQEFLDTLQQSCNLTEKEAQSLVEAIPLALSELLKAGETLFIPDFGTFQLHKRLERVVENAATKRRTLTPPRLILRFRPLTTAKPTYTLHHLAQSVARRTDTEVTTALPRLATAFRLIAEGIQRDAFTSVIALGAFRKEHDSTTGITKLVFAPDESLSKLVNRPFAELPAVELAPETDLAALEAINAEFESHTEPDNADNETIEEQNDETASASEPAVNDTEEAKSEAETSTTETASEHNDTELTISDAETPIEETGEAESSSSESVTDEEYPIENERVDKSNMYWRRTAIVLLVGFLGLSIFTLTHIGSRTVLQDAEPSSAAGDTLATASDTATAAADTIPSDSFSDGTPRTQILPVKNNAEVFNGFEIDGTLDTHTVEFGDILVRVAEHYYGNPFFVKYIIQYNGLPANGHADVGTVLKIPHLKRKTPTQEQTTP